MKAYPKFVCEDCDSEYHALVNPVVCPKCGSTLFVEDDEEPDPDIPLGLYYWSQQQKERAIQAQAAAIVRGFEMYLAEVSHGNEDQEEDLP